MGDGLTLSKQEERRIEVLTRVLAKQLTLREAAPLLGVGERQARRLLRQYAEAGPRGIVHGNRGRQPARTTPAQVREQVAALASGRYAGVNHSHLAELLQERESITLPRSTLARILTQAGLRSPRPKRRRSRHRSRRERYPQEGLLLQTDASHHDWLEGRGPQRLVLLAVIDDATGKVPAARFHTSEDTEGYFLLMRDLCRRTGVPQALYSDKHAVFWSSGSESLAEQLAGRRSATQFGRAMAELGVQLIAAHSPQAKGRVERLWDTLQDRLVAELRLAGVSCLEEANAYLPGFLDRFNRSFAVPPEQPGSAYRPRLSHATLNDILCFRHERVVSNDNLVKVDSVVLQILPGANRRGYNKATVIVQESLDHRFSVHFEGRTLASKRVLVRKLLTPKPRERTPTPALLPPESKAQKPAPEHPWRKAVVTKSLST
jgi:transposase